MKRFCVLVVVVLGSCVALISLAKLGGWLIHGPTLRDWNRIESGQCEQTVREIAGEPLYEYVRSDAPEDYYIRGWPRKERGITGKVLVYRGGVDLVMYAWLDPDEKVEEVFITGS